MWHLLEYVARRHRQRKDEPLPEPLAGARRRGHLVHDEILAILGRALAIRQVDAGSCNACELEIHALNNPYYNIEGHGIRFVASPRHADMLLVTGPVSRHLEVALRRTYDATPAPKLVVAVGECACEGGIFGESYASCGRVSNVIPVDVVVSGCPPPPADILAGILAAVRSRASAEEGDEAVPVLDPEPSRSGRGKAGGDTPTP